MHGPPWWNYMDDVTIGGDISVVARDVEMVSSMGVEVGLELNHDNKCELVYRILEKRCLELERMILRIELLASQDALLILRTAFGSSRLMNVLRSSPCAEHYLLVEFDDLLRSGVSKVTNCAIDDTAWIQASLPTNDGGLGIRSVVVLAPSAFLASAAATFFPQSAILGEEWSLRDPHVAHIKQLWCSTFTTTPPEGDLALKQRNWDRPAIEMGKSVLTSVVDTPSDRARLLAVSAPHAGDWLRALPIASCGLRLEDDAVRVGVGIRLGLNICEPHRWVCGCMVDQLGLHALSFGIGRLSRHGIINDIVCRAFTSAGIPAIKEPTGLIKGGALPPLWHDFDSLIRRPILNLGCDCGPHACPLPRPILLTLFMWLGLRRRRQLPGRSISMTSTHLFVPIALETLGPVCEAALDLISTLGSRITERSGDSRERSFLFQRLSIAIQRGNSVALHGTFGEFDPTWVASKHGSPDNHYGTIYIYILYHLLNLRSNAGWIQSNLQL